MKTLLSVFLVGFTVSIRANGQTSSLSGPEVSRQKTVETLVCIRHGEKPPGGLGQLNCRGLNRALALPDVLLKKYGAPQFVFAPLPTLDGTLDGVKYYYVRPLITIEPTAIRCGLPVNTEFSDVQINGLEKELEKQKYQNAVVFIAWEHAWLDKFARNLVKQHGENPAKVPDWPENDYDTIFVFKITKDAGRESFAFTIDHEGLNGLSDKCP